MHNVSSLVVYERSILAGRMKPIRKDQRLVFAGCAYLFITLPVTINLPHVHRSTKTVFHVSGSHESRNPFVQPEMIPITTSHHVAPPLMCKFMCTQPESLLVRQYSLAVPFVQCRKAA